MVNEVIESSEVLKDMIMGWEYTEPHDSRPFFPGKKG